jgi:hypothetical protein
MSGKSMSNDYLKQIREGSPLFAGVATREITPADSAFLMGYPHVHRYSTGVHDPLLSTALYLEAGGERVMFIANDIIYAPKALVARARTRIAEKVGIPGGHILISATHTHSGPKTCDTLSNEADSAVPKADPEYVRFFEDRIVEAGIAAAQKLTRAEIGLAVADATGIGTNRRDPDGSRDLEVPVLLVRDLEHKLLAAMLVCNMHPTVLHEDSTLISGDFPAMARQYLQKNLFPLSLRERVGVRANTPDKPFPVLYHTGPAGNQSPRHVTRGNTFAEAERLGEILGQAAAKVIPAIEFRQRINLECRRSFADLPVREFPSEAEAQAQVQSAELRLKNLRDRNAPRTEIRTAEVDWFGATETLTLSRAATLGRLAEAASACMPAEIQAILVGPWTFVAWPGELFVEFGLELKQRCPNTFPITYANGTLQGYLVTKQAVQEGGYESSNAVFKSPDGGDILVHKTLELLADRVAE